MRFKIVMAALLAVAVVTDVGVTLSTRRAAAVEGKAPAVDPAAAIAQLQARVNELEGQVPDQAIVMTHVAYHFTNLWFAARQHNWPLADFYLGEVRKDLKWAVRVIPVRKDKEEREVDLRAILDALEQTTLKDLDAAVKSNNKEKFTTAYKAQLENCMACHRAVSKEYIRLHLPERADAGMVEFAGEKGAGQ